MGFLDTKPHHKPAHPPRTPQRIARPILIPSLSSHFRTHPTAFTHPPAPKFIPRLALRRVLPLGPDQPISRPGRIDRSSDGSEKLEACVPRFGICAVYGCAWVGVYAKGRSDWDVDSRLIRDEGVGVEGLKQSK